MDPQVSLFFFYKKKNISISVTKNPINVNDIIFQDNRVIYHQNMTPSWLEAHASYIYRRRFSTPEQLTFDKGPPDNGALLKVPLIPADILEDSTLISLKIVVSMDDDIKEHEHSRPAYGVSDGVSFLGFEANARRHFSARAPCFGVEGTSGDILTGRTSLSKVPTPKESFYDGQFVITLKLNEHWGSCYTAHDGGFVKTAAYNKRLLLSKGLTLEVYKFNNREKVKIKFIEVTVM